MASKKKAAKKAPVKLKGAKGFTGKKALKPNKAPARGKKLGSGLLFDTGEFRDPKIQKLCERLSEARNSAGIARQKANEINEVLVQAMADAKIESYKADDGKMYFIKNARKVNSKNMDAEAKKKARADEKERANAMKNHGINPMSKSEKDIEPLDDEPAPTGQSEVLDGVRELAEEGSEK